MAEQIEDFPKIHSPFVREENEAYGNDKPYYPDKGDGYNVMYDYDTDKYLLVEVTYGDYGDVHLHFVMSDDDVQEFREKAPKTLKGYFKKNYKDKSFFGFAVCYYNGVDMPSIVPK